MMEAHAEVMHLLCCAECLCLCVFACSRPPAYPTRPHAHCPLQLGLKDADAALTDAIAATRRMARGDVEGEGSVGGGAGAGGDPLDLDGAEDAGEDYPE